MVQNGGCGLLGISCCKSSIDRRRVIHSIKVGIALVVVSLLYMINSMFKQVGEDAMWAIMTVVVMFEFYAGATLRKGINRGIGTMVGGGMGCLATILAERIGGNDVGKCVAIGVSLFTFGCGATYCRSVPRLKKKYDYGFMISILTFSLVAVSGVHDAAGNIVKLALDRLVTIGMGFGVCVSVSLFVFPIWAGDELHYTTATKFEKLANSIQGCLDEYFRVGSDEKGNTQAPEGVTTASDHMQDCQYVLNSKSNDESLANYAKWEPWHGKFGQYYPWGKYLKIGDHLKQLAATILSLNQCLHSPKQPLPTQRQTETLVIKEASESFSLSIGWILKEVGEGMKNRDLCQPKFLNPKLQSLKTLQFSSTGENANPAAIATLNFLLLEIVEGVEELVETVEQLGHAASFQPPIDQV